MSRPGPDADTTLERIAALNRKLIEGVVKPLGLDAGFDTAEILKSLSAGIAQDSHRWLELQNRHYRQHLELWARYAMARPGAAAQPSNETVATDRRFRAPEWREQPYFEYVAQSYLLSARWL